MNLSLETKASCPNCQHSIKNLSSKDNILPIKFSKHAGECCSIHKQWLSPGALSSQVHCLLHLSSSRLVVYSTGAHRFCSQAPAGTLKRVFSLSVVMQPESQHHREPDPEDESEALQEPQVWLPVGLGFRVVLRVGGGLAAADLGEDVHRGHVEESPGGEEHSHTCRAELALRRTARLQTQTPQIRSHETPSGGGVMCPLWPRCAFLPRVI